MEKLKITDLSIGDWVQYEGQNRKIRAINDSTSLILLSNSPNFVGVGGVGPVPITPEILKKNGFDFYTEYLNSFVFDISTNSRIWLFKNSHDWTFQIMDSGLGFSHCIVKMLVKYIHQLQHALRLAGVNKEIQL